MVIFIFPARDIESIPNLKIHFVSFMKPLNKGTEDYSFFIYGCVVRPSSVSLTIKIERPDHLL